MTDVDGAVSGRAADRDPVPDRDANAVVSAHTTTPGRTVLTDRDNSDAWIASDLTLECSR